MGNSKESNRLAREQYEGVFFETQSSGSCVILEYINYHNVVVKFTNTNGVVSTSLGNLKKGLVKDATIPLGLDVLGKEFSSNRFGRMRIIAYEDANNVTVKFINTGNLKVAKLCHIKGGNVADDYVPTCCGVGYIGGGYDLGTTDLNSKAFKLWSGMLERCYSESQRHRHPTYKDCYVSDNFKNLSYFKEWCSKQIGFNVKGFALDKDILVKGNRIYSEDTCCFVHYEINCTLTKSEKSRGNLPIGVQKDSKRGRFKSLISAKNKQRSYLGTYDTPEEAFYAYKKVKEQRIKTVSNKWKDHIDQQVYDALINYQVEITD